MNNLRTIVQIARADFLERIRRFGFALTLVFAVFAAYVFVPPNHMNYATLFFDSYRGIYNSAWVGAQVAILASAYMILMGFYLVRNGINRDRETGVGQIIAATPVTKTFYALGKWLSNCGVLSAIVVVLMFGAAALQLIRGEDTTVKPLLIIAPFLYLLIPTLALVSSLAVLFECIPKLRGAFGNILYFFVVPQSVLPEVLGGPKIMGITLVTDHMREVCRSVYPEYTTGLSIGFNTHGDGRPFDLLTYVWDGMPITWDFILYRAVWILLAVAVVFVAAVPFERFDTARLQKSIKRKRFWNRKKATVPAVPDRVPAPAQANGALTAATASVHLTPLPGNRSRMRIWGLLKANLTLVVKSMPWWWHIGALGLIAAGIAVPKPFNIQFVLPFAWLWPIAIWAPLGNREIRNATHELIFSAAHPLRRIVPAAWLTGVVAGLFVTSGAVVRLLIFGEWLNLGALLVGAVFVPSLALALGAWSRSSRLFEVLYLFWWYIGPFNAIPALNFGGAFESESTLLIAGSYGAAALVLLIFGFIGARRQLQV